MYIKVNIHIYTRTVNIYPSTYIYTNIKYMYTHYIPSHTKTHHLEALVA